MIFCMAQLQGQQHSSPATISSRCRKAAMVPTGCGLRVPCIMRSITANPSLIDKLMIIKISSYATLAFALFCLYKPAGAEQARIDGRHMDEVLIGKIYEKDSNLQDLLFNFRRTARRAGDLIHVTRTYAYPGGRTAAIEKATYNDHRLVSYTLIEKQIGARGRAEIQGDAQAGSGKISFRYEKDGETYTNVEDLASATVVNDNIVPYLRAHWDELMQGKEVESHYIVIPRTRTVGFNLIKSGETTWHGKPAVIIKMLPSSWFISLVVDPVYFTVVKDNRQVVKYEGRVTPKIEENGEWQDLDAVMLFR